MLRLPTPPPVTAPVGLVRRTLAQVLRAKVAGKDADRHAARIWGATGPRWFTPADPIWRVHADSSMFLGGIRALLLQSLHPLAMAGVAQHSGFRGDPWGRLERTSHYLATTTFGTAADAERIIAVVRTIHERVRGTADDGRPYAAGDPHLLAWVHVAEIDSFLRTHQVFGAAPLTDAEADLYVEQAGQVAHRLGVLDPPTDVASMHRTLAAFRPELRSTPDSRDAARFLLLDPPLPLAARPGYGLLAAGAVSTLPGWARRELRLPPPFVAWDLPSRWLGRTGAQVVRWAMTDPSLTADRTTHDADPQQAAS